MGSEIRQRDFLADLIGKSPVWLDWTGVAEADALKRVAWPTFLGGPLPFCTLQIGSSQHNRRPSQGSRSSFRATGEITALFLDWVGGDQDGFNAYDSGVRSALESSDFDTAHQLMKDEDSRFGGRVSDLVDEMLSSQRLALGGQLLRRSSKEPAPWRRIGPKNVEVGNPNAENAEDFTGPWWQCPVVFEWGVS